MATSECGLFSQGFFLGAGAGTCPFTSRYSRHCLLLAGWLPWQLAHFLITVLPDCMAQVRLVFFSAEGTDGVFIFTSIFLVTVLLAIGAPFRCGHHFRGFVVFILDR